ncbi:leucine-rich repeat flightless-interacting protein 2 isoform X2 [Vanessa cardui]|uniref:leucine-rich repeat flightless-interacting protein 2 isoform X2 n=1 Tax=Vanessa cardui TaxID=171605 RepID=UPI001F145B81|nr:leucine-rich repeat flightless-interacting protein 2 isoform X2 [Vanessa cardui]
MTLTMGERSDQAISENSDEESGEAFTDGDFEDSGDETVIERSASSKTSHIPLNETVNSDININNTIDETDDILEEHINGHTELNGSDDDDVKNVKSSSHSNGDNSLEDLHVDSQSDSNGSIVGILGDQQSHAEQRLAARRAARAEAREIRMRELERQQREQEDHADKAYDMYAVLPITETVGRRTGSRLAAMSPSVLHSPRRSSEDSDDVLSIKDLRHELKEVEEKFRKAMILNAQLDNDKAALGYQLELLKDRIEELQEEYAQLQREHKEKCSSHERLKREHASLEREVVLARDAVRARDAAAAAAGRAFVEAAAAPDALAGQPCGSVPPLALVSHHSQQLLDDAGEGTLDVRLERLAGAKAALEGEVRKLKLQLNEERAARQNGVAHPERDVDCELEALRKAASEAKARAARAEAEAALHAAAVVRLEAQVARLRARQDHQDEHEELLKQERRRLQREAREALNRVEELETENSHLTKRLDKLKNAKSALLKDL